MKQENPTLRPGSPGIVLAIAPHGVRWLVYRLRRELYEAAYLDGLLVRLDVRGRPYVIESNCDATSCRRRSLDLRTVRILQATRPHLLPLLELVW